MLVYTTSTATHRHLYIQPTHTSAVTSAHGSLLYAASGAPHCAQKAPPVLRAPQPLCRVRVRIGVRVRIRVKVRVRVMVEHHLQKLCDEPLAGCTPFSASAPTGGGASSDPPATAGSTMPIVIADVSTAGAPLP